MAEKIGRKALIPNPALTPFTVFVGEWQTVGTHPALSGTTLHGRTTFAWCEGGAFVVMHSEIDDPTIPNGGALLGSDAVAKTYYMLYFDERGISRKYDVTLAGNQLTWWRDEPRFSQRCTTRSEDTSNTLISTGEMAREGAAWEKDLALTYVRVR